MDERVIELNLPAKARYLEHFKKQRRNEMRQWRQQHHLLFATDAAFQDWLDYTKWYKRPMKKEGLVGGMVNVKFLDHPFYKAQVD